MPLLQSHEDEERIGLGGGNEQRRGFIRGSGIMKSIRKSFRRRKKETPQTRQNQKPNEWLEDELKVKNGTCQFKVKYLGALEVKDSRGISHCEEAVKRHKQRKERNKRRALLCISPETIRLVKEKNKQLIIDQTIEKVSFCAPDSNYEKAFSYICREGTTKRWMCHSFTANGGETGERLSHAVGTAFKACLEKKKDLERVNQTLNENQETNFSESSSKPAIATTSSTPATATVVTVDAEVMETEDKADSEGEKKIFFEIKSLPRPHAPDHMKRQASLRAFVPSPKQEAFKTTKSARNFTLAEKFRGKEVLNAVPEVEGDSDVQKPVQAVQPFTRNPLRTTIATATPMIGQNYAQVRKPTSVEPIREINPWANDNMVRSQTEPAFPAFTSNTIQKPTESPSVQPQNKNTIQNSASFSVPRTQSRGDAWVESLRQDIVALKTGESVTSTISGTSSKQAPTIPARTGRAAVQHFNRNISQNMSMRSPVTSVPHANAFIRSQSVRYGSSGLSSTSSSPNPFQEAPFPVSNSFEAEWEALGRNTKNNLSKSIISSSGRV